MQRFSFYICKCKKCSRKSLFGRLLRLVYCLILVCMLCNLPCTITLNKIMLSIIKETCCFCFCKVAFHSRRKTFSLRNQNIITSFRGLRMEPVCTDWVIIYRIHYLTLALCVVYNYKIALSIALYIATHTHTHIYAYECACIHTRTNIHHIVDCHSVV